eukprot:CAMPEP_0114312250 /NCGR_PEP_ID=MMETSP0059-20121206/20316_1 /TAXON_ID=36894 /ORGANISM="Pyramimonas parkeae, Strain CCMP726" /LENGTH=65 /DNA_ID=CAMNT_0001436595 /DNA_START=238 /DNA_END=435 /DNA_ORIENTATION=+
MAFGTSSAEIIPTSVWAPTQASPQITPMPPLLTLGRPTIRFLRRSLFSALENRSWDQADTRVEVC